MRARLADVAGYRHPPFGQMNYLAQKKAPRDSYISTGPHSLRPSRSGVDRMVDRIISHHSSPVQRCDISGARSEFSSVVHGRAVPRALVRAESATVLR